MGEARQRGTFCERRAQAIARTLREARLVVLKADDPQANAPDWTPVLPDDVPDTVRRPDVMGRLVRGYICQADGAGPWYRVERVSEPERRVVLV